MIFKVIKAFKDLQNSNLIYNVGDVFPREGKEVSRKRLNDLSTDNNLQKQPVIESIESTEDVSERPNYSDMKVSELKKIAKERALNGYSDMKKAELVELLEGGK
ncbi:Rho termination factor N-terminal domain-containing protein [Staphylococcus equorum]|uniref:Rho termination factor N-terminal domain-containing protein n=1 Tax=Staphylococcus equorum TaxID=246432 RepID=UPI00203D2254|nr:Rho termination factor N-terminal domain-containing protein [Staphylococcus equorum]